MSAHIQNPATPALTTHRADAWTDRLIQAVASHRIALTLAVVIIAAAVARLVNLGHDSLSHDECWRANFAHHGTLNQMRWFAPGQLAVYWLIQNLISRTEFWIRLPDALLGILTVVLTYTVAKPRLGKPTALAAAAFIAFHAETLFYSRVLKEFSFEAVLTLLILSAGAKATDRFNTRNLLIFYATAVLGLCFGFSPILVAAAWGPFLIAAAWRDQPRRIANIKLLALLTAALVPIVLAWFLWLDGCDHRLKVVEYFNIHEHAWLSTPTATSFATWMTVQSIGLWKFVCGIIIVWDPLATAMLAVISIVALAGFGDLLQRWPRLVKFTLVLLAINVVLALLRRWPFGPYRSSLYLVPIFAMLVGCGLTRIVHRLRSVGVTAMVVGVCIIIPAGRATKHTIIYPTESEHLRPVLARVRQFTQPTDGIFAYYATSDAMEFYWPNAGENLFMQPHSQRGQFDMFKTAFDRMASRFDRVWFIFTHDHHDERITWTHYVLSRGDVVYQFGSADTFAYCIDTRSTSREDTLRRSKTPRPGPPMRDLVSTVTIN